MTTAMIASISAKINYKQSLHLYFTISIESSVTNTHSEQIHIVHTSRNYLQYYHSSLGYHEFFGHVFCNDIFDR